MNSPSFRLSQQQQNTQQKIFIIGLPRTGTTSICASLLTLGYKVAHTAYVQKAFDDAQVLADTPVFHHYQYLDKKYANAKFIYLSRKKTKWLPSIKQLLQRMSVNLLRDDGGFNPTIKECYLTVFSPFTLDNINDDSFLSTCYDKHHNEINQYFVERENDLLTIDISENGSYQLLLNFLNKSKNNKVATKESDFPKYNAGGKVTAWKDIKHVNKIESTNKGRAEKMSFL